jgi:AraC-like DNA-binding protein
MSISRQRQALRRQAQQFFEDQLHRLPTRAAEAQHTAQQAQALAHQAGDKLLEAEATLLRCRWLAPVSDPAALLAELQAATAVFTANQLPHRALAAGAATAAVLFQLGEERHAIAVAQRVLAQPGLAPEDAAVATYALALAHGQLGELDLALQLLEERGLKLAAAAAAAQPLLPARMAWLRARLWRQVYVHHRHPALWRGLPLAAGLLHVRAAAPTAEAVVQLYAEADGLLPPGQTWPYGEITRHTLRGLGAPAPQAEAALQALADMAEALWTADPPAAGWALLCQAKLLLDQGRLAAALPVVLRARERAEALQLRTLVRDLWLYEARAREGLGDSAGALLAFKRLAIHRIRSLAALPDTPAATPQGASLPPSPLRNLEPPHVRRALRYIDEHLREPLPVQAVVQHCGVGRRTLEIAFKESKGCTLADHIRRRKLELAAQQLRLTGQTVQQVAASLGFGSAATFSRDFAAQFGMPPSQWLRQQGGEPAALQLR